MSDRGDRDAIETAGRLQAMGVEIRSAELTAKAKAAQEFAARGGNRQMRRAAKRRRS
jgi:hypothetical protein